MRSSLGVRNTTMAKDEIKMCVCARKDDRRRRVERVNKEWKIKYNADVDRRAHQCYQHFLLHLFMTRFSVSPTRITINTIIESFVSVLFLIRVVFVHLPTGKPPERTINKFWNGNSIGRSIASEGNIFHNCIGERASVIPNRFRDLQRRYVVPLLPTSTLIPAFPKACVEILKLLCSVFARTLQCPEHHRVADNSFHHLQVKHVPSFRIRRKRHSTKDDKNGYVPW